MSPELLEIQPPELKFTFELKEKSLCSVQLFNNSDQYVAFKVKTTSPKKYFVRPNIDIIKPKSTCDFTVTMQAQQLAPPDMQCQDKFLIQSTIVPFGTTAKEITHGMFSKDNGKYIEENKLRVVLISKIAKDVEEFRTSKDEDVLIPAKDTKEFKLAKEIEELKSKLNELELKLSEAELTIAKLTKERSTTIEERETLQQELVVLRRKSGARRVQVGFPFWFVCMVALISVALGYLLYR